MSLHTDFKFVFLTLEISVKCVRRSSVVALRPFATRWLCTEGQPSLRSGESSASRVRAHFDRRGEDRPESAAVLLAVRDALPVLSPPSLCSARRLIGRTEDGLRECCCDMLEARASLAWQRLLLWLVFASVLSAEGAREGLVLEEPSESWIAQGIAAISNPPPSLQHLFSFLPGPLQLRALKQPTVDFPE